MKSELARLVLQVADKQAAVVVLSHQMDTCKVWAIDHILKEYEEAKRVRDEQVGLLDTLCAKIEGDLTTVWDDWHYRRNEEGGFD
jgi:hypothetical protein